MLRVLVTDNDPAFLKSLRSSLEKGRVPVEIFEAQSGKEALDLLDENEYDALTLDIDMPEMNGLEALERVKTSHPNLPVLMLTFLPEEDESVSRALKLGADGYLYKWKSRTELLPALERIVPTAHKPANFASLRSRLTWREDKVLRMIGAGMNEPQIARELGLSLQAIRIYKHSIFEKMGFRDESEIHQYIFWLG